MAGGKLALVAIAVALLAPAAARADFTAPELYVAEGDSSSLQNQAPVWQPLGSAKVVGAYRYRLGVKLQSNSAPLGRECVLTRAARSPKTPGGGGSATIPGPGSCMSVRGT